MALATLLYNVSIANTDSCKAYKSVSLTAALRLLHQVLEPIDSALSSKLTKEESFAKDRIFGDHVYNLIGIPDKYSTSKMSCEIESMSFVKPKENFASILKQIEDAVTEPPNFSFDDKKIWVNLNYDPRTEAYYFGDDTYPLYWGNNMEIPSVKPDEFDPTKCYRIIVPNSYNEDTAFTVEAVACKNGQALTLCQAPIPERYEALSSLRTVYKKEFNTIKENFPDASAAITALEKADWCDKYKLSNIDELFLQHPLEEVEALLQGETSMSTLLELLPNLANDYATAMTIIERLEDSALSTNKKVICVCQRNPLEELYNSVGIELEEDAENSSNSTSTRPKFKSNINITELISRAKEELPNWISKHVNPKLLDIIFSIIGGITGIITLLISVFLIIRNCQKDGFLCIERQRFVALKVPGAKRKAPRLDEQEMTTFRPKNENFSSGEESDNPDVYFVTKNAKKKTPKMPSRPPRRSPRSKRSVKLIDVAHVHQIVPRRHSSYSCYSEDEIQAASRKQSFYD